MNAPRGHSGSSSIASLERALSKLGYCSRSKAGGLISGGAVKVNGQIILDPAQRVNTTKDKIEINGTVITKAENIYLMLNKPRGVLTTSSDEKGRDTVFSCFGNENFPHIFPVGRLDKASEGLLLFTNDTKWGNYITDPETKIFKTYHVQINFPANDSVIESIKNGITYNGILLNVIDVKPIRTGEKNCWLEIILDEGKNRHIRNIFEALEIEVLRLIRIKIGMLELGSLGKGEYRHLSKAEIDNFAPKNAII